MLEEIKNIIFDLGGVMIDLNKERCIREFHKIGFSEIDSLIDSYHPRGVFRRIELGEMSNEAFFDHVRSCCGRDVPDEAIRGAFLSFIDGIPRYKLQMVRSLREKGFRTFALSNINDVVFPYIREVLFAQEGLTLGDYFEKVFLSYEMHLLKPSPEIYQRMIAESGIRPEETLFIDDSESNIAAAAELGFNVYLAGAREDFRHLFREVLPE